MPFEDPGVSSLYIIGTESHLKADIKNAEVFPSNYDRQIHRVDRRDGRKGGGVFIVARDDIDLTPLPEQTPSSSETAWAELMTTRGKVIIGAHYRPPRSNDDSIHSLDDSISKVRSKYKKAKIVLGGDFNLPGISWSTLSTQQEASDAAQCNKLLDIAQAQNLEQLVHEPTRGENTMDLCFTSSPGLVNRCTTGPGISDHDHIVIVDTKLTARHNKNAPRKVQMFNKTDWTQVKSDIVDLEQAFFDRNPSEETINENWFYFKDQINQIVHVTARIPTKMFRGRHDLPWLTREAKHLARQKNRAHTKAKHTKSDRDWKRFRLLRKSLQNEGGPPGLH